MSLPTSDPPDPRPNPHTHPHSPSPKASRGASRRRSARLLHSHANTPAKPEAKVQAPSSRPFSRYAPGGLGGEGEGKGEDVVDVDMKWDYDKDAGGDSTYYVSNGIGIYGRGRIRRRGRPRGSKGGRGGSGQSATASVRGTGPGSSRSRPYVLSDGAAAGEEEEHDAEDAQGQAHNHSHQHPQENSTPARAKAKSKWKQKQQEQQAGEYELDDEVDAPPPEPQSSEGGSPISLREKKRIKASLIVKLKFRVDPWVLSKFVAETDSEGETQGIDEPQETSDAEAELDMDSIRQDLAAEIAQFEGHDGGMTAMRQDRAPLIEQYGGADNDDDDGDDIQSMPAEYFPSEGAEQGSSYGVEESEEVDDGHGEIAMLEPGGVEPVLQNQGHQDDDGFLPPWAPLSIKPKVAQGRDVLEDDSLDISDAAGQGRDATRFPAIYSNSTSDREGIERQYFDDAYAVVDRRENFQLGYDEYGNFERALPRRSRNMRSMDVATAGGSDTQPLALLASVALSPPQVVQQPLTAQTYSDPHMYHDNYHDYIRLQFQYHYQQQYNRLQSQYPDDYPQQQHLEEQTEQYYPIHATPYEVDTTSHHIPSTPPTPTHPPTRLPPQYPQPHSPDSFLKDLHEFTTLLEQPEYIAEQKRELEEEQQIIMMMDRLRQGVASRRREKKAAVASTSGSGGGSGSGSSAAPSISPSMMSIPAPTSTTADNSNSRPTSFTSPSEAPLTCEDDEPSSPPRIPPRPRVPVTRTWGGIFEGTIENGFPVSFTRVAAPATAAAQRQRPGHLHNHNHNHNHNLNLGHGQGRSLGDSGNGVQRRASSSYSAQAYAEEGQFQHQFQFQRSHPPEPSSSPPQINIYHCDDHYNEYGDVLGVNLASLSPLPAASAPVSSTRRLSTEKMDVDLLINVDENVGPTLATTTTSSSPFSSQFAQQQQQGGGEDDKEDTFLLPPPFHQHRRHRHPFKNLDQNENRGGGTTTASSTPTRAQLAYASDITPSLSSPLNARFSALAPSSHASSPAPARDVRAEMDINFMTSGGDEGGHESDPGPAGANVSSESESSEQFPSSDGEFPLSFPRGIPSSEAEEEEGDGKKKKKGKEKEKDGKEKKKEGKREKDIGAGLEYAYQQFRNAFSRRI
ncbi:hypothetical protein DFH27DRAFT_637322 [Peziza echinospora]|nr:hypothetical protein DFH27DRAFT_637322 [Peziza echinospora]